MQLRQQLVLPTFLPSVGVHVCDGEKALLCHLDVQGGDQLRQLDDEGGGEVCLLDVEKGGKFCQLGGEACQLNVDDDQLCYDVAGDGQAEEALPNSREHFHCRIPSPNLLSAQHATSHQTWSQRMTLLCRSSWRS